MCAIQRHILLFKKHTYNVSSLLMLSMNVTQLQVTGKNVFTAAAQRLFFFKIAGNCAIYYRSWSGI